MIYCVSTLDGGKEVKEVPRVDLWVILWNPRIAARDARDSYELWCKLGCDDQVALSRAYTTLTSKLSKGLVMGPVSWRL